jgi:hypothetical protein
MSPNEGNMSFVTPELSVLKRVGEGLDALGVAYMLTGSFAMARYTVPRMTRDIDLVVALAGTEVEALVRELSRDFYVDADAVADAIRLERLFNVMHLATAIKVDLIVRKQSAYRRTEFERRQRAAIDGVSTWVVSREDLILSKLVWARDTQSEVQRRDIRQLLEGTCDMPYIRQWAPTLGVHELLNELTP